MTIRPLPRLLRPQDAAAAAELLRKGGIIAMPTDTVYGFAASLDAPAAVARLYDLKDRPRQKAIPVLLSHRDQLERIAGEHSRLIDVLAEKFWPGALTLVVAARPGLPPQVTSTDETGKRTVAVRVPDHPVALAVIRAAGGALAVTSANRSGEAPATSPNDILNQGITGLDAIVDGGRSPIGQPSTIITLSGDVLTVLRTGAIDETTVRQQAQFARSPRTSDRAAGYDLR